MNLAVRDQRQALLYFAGGAASYLLLSGLFRKLTSRPPHRALNGAGPIHPSPFETQAAVLETAARNVLPYPPTNVLPGARDVSTPYGSIRVYEFGPEDAERKVLFIHGITTPCIAMATMAESLAEKGCRVMLFDLFGRGWSEAPSDLPYDERLYISQVLLVLASSPVSWKYFSVVGYSMGGGIAVSFTYYFPEMIDDLVLVAPAGLIRSSPIPWFARTLDGLGLMPESVLAKLVIRRLLARPNVPTKPAVRETTTADGSVRPELEEDKAVSHETAPAEELNKTSLGYSIDPQKAVAWQIKNHIGFVPAFISSMKKAPIIDQQDRWATLGNRLDAQRHTRQSLVQNLGRDLDAEGQQKMRQGLQSGKILIVLGELDMAVKPDELGPDARDILRPQNVEIRMLENSGHELAVTRGTRIAEEAWSFWQESSG